MSKAERAFLMAGIFALGLFAGVALACAVYMNAAEAEGGVTYYCWALCLPGSDVMIREKPGKRAEAIGAVSCGDKMETDWKEKDGFIHVFNLASETGEGWISSRYVVAAEPEIIGEEREIVGGGRVACRKWIEGPRKAWAKAGSFVTVYAKADGWAVTNRGYIQSRYIGGAE